MNKIDFKNLGRKNIRCMMFEVKEGDVRVTYENFEEFKKQYGEVVEIYNPNKDQKEKISNMINNNLNVTTDKAKITISGDDFLLDLLGELTNISLTLDKKKDKEKIQEILNDPSDLLLKINLEINKICNNVFYMIYDSAKEIMKAPDEIREIIVGNNINNTKDEPNQEEIEKQNKILELENQLKSLKGE